MVDEGSSDSIIVRMHRELDKAVDAEKCINSVVRAISYSYVRDYDFGDKVNGDDYQDYFIDASPEVALVHANLLHYINLLKRKINELKEASK